MMHMILWQAFMTKFLDVSSLYDKIMKSLSASISNNASNFFYGFFLLKPRNVNNAISVNRFQFGDFKLGMYLFYKKIYMKCI